VISDLAIPFLVVLGLLAVAIAMAHTAYRIGRYQGRTPQDLLDEALAEQNAVQLLNDPARLRRALKRNSRR